MEKVWISGVCEKCECIVDRKVDIDYDYPDPFICTKCNQPERSKREDSFNIPPGELK